MPILPTSNISSPGMRLLEEAEAVALINTHLPNSQGRRRPTAEEVNPQTGTCLTLIAVPKVLSAIFRHLSLKEVLTVTSSCKMGLQLRQAPLVQLMLAGHAIQKLQNRFSEIHIDKKPENSFLLQRDPLPQAAFNDFSYTYLDHKIGKR